MHEDSRAWVEIDLGALAYNSAQLRSHLPKGCNLMAIVKADAYGHGAERVAERLWDEGVKAFAVATLSEGIRLREKGLDGDILVLSYTHPRDAALLSDYRLAQLIVDGAHAKAMNDTGYKMHVHIAIDTGMRREGIVVSNLAELESIFKYKNLSVEGVATHLSSSDSLSEDDDKFTKRQIERFFSAVDCLKSKGYNTGKLHFQASYGIFNYPDIRCDYARAGIGLYGLMSHDEETRVRLDLRPALSLKAVIAQTRWISSGESVSYGRTFTADKPMKLATICIGYADGVPRHMSGNNGACIVNGSRAPIIGRICMDLLMADVTEVESAVPGDVATLIGKDGAEAIRCEEVAKASGTITNEILCRLGSRLPRIYKKES